MTEYFYLTVIGGLCSVILAIISSYYSQKNKKEEIRNQNLTEKLILLKEAESHMKDVKLEISLRYDKIENKLLEMSSWQTTFQLELLSLKKDLESLSNDMFNLKLLYNPLANKNNHGASLPRQTSDSKRKGEYIKS